MSDVHHNYPSLKDDMRIEVYASSAKREAGIMIDRPFGDKLKHIELHNTSKELLFYFEEKGIWALGNPIQDLVISILNDLTFLGIIQIDLKTRQPLSIFKVPLKIT